MRLDAANQLASWGLSLADAQRAGLYTVDSAAELHPSYPHEPVLVLPYHTPTGQPLMVHGQQFSRIRRLQLPAETPSFGRKRKHAKYLQPPATGVHAYFPPPANRAWPDVLADVSAPLIITEGEAKALVGAREGFPVIALGGVWSFMTRAGALIPELAGAAWQGRPVYICFDSDAAANPDIVAAEARLIYELQTVLGATCHVVRLPSGEGGTKMGLDDFLNAHGAEELDKLLLAAAPLDALDAKVISLNRALAWIEFEAQVYDIEADQFIRKEQLVKGSRWSSIKHVVPAGRSGGTKVTSVADAWLTHPHAQRYGRVLFRPNEPLVTRDSLGHSALNMWRPWECGPGDVTPWLELSDYLFSNLPEDIRDLPVKLMIYKTQNPTQKPALAPLLIGPQGCGKGMWLDALYKAYDPYSHSCNASAFVGNFQGWLERKLLVTVHEIKPDEVERCSEQLKHLISEKTQDMNEKFRPARQIESYGQYALSSNHRGVGSFADDDRRMIVVNCPKPRDDNFYARFAAWRDNGGPKHLLHWMLNYDLQGWTPPARAPVTAEKRIAYQEGLTIVQRLAQDMRVAGEHVIQTWLSAALAWAEQNMQSTWPNMVALARSVHTNVENFQIRPWYSPDELSLIFPAAAQELMGNKLTRNRPVGQLSRELRDAGIPYLECKDSPEGFKWHGRMSTYLVVADQESWSRPLSQADFERYMRGWETFSQYRRRLAAHEQARRAAAFAA